MTITGARGKITIGDDVIGFVGDVTINDDYYSMKQIRFVKGYNANNLFKATLEVLDKKSLEVLYKRVLDSQMNARVSNGILSVEIPFKAVEE